ncbi:MAG: hypothetical protein ACYC21_15810 [Eubacteriales bacterium]
MRNKKYSLAAVSVILVIVVAAVAANPVPVIGRWYSCEQISAIKLSPAFYKDGPVTIVGKVVEYKKHFGIFAYKVADKTGDITVFYDGSTTPGPTVGSFVVTRGSIEQIEIPGSKAGVFVKEQKRLFSWKGKGKVELKTDSI